MTPRRERFDPQQGLRLSPDAFALSFSVRVIGGVGGNASPPVSALRRLVVLGVSILVASFVSLTLGATTEPTAPATERTSAPVGQVGNIASTPEDLWKDPTFRKQFLGSYGFQSDLEPKLTPLERDEMEKILTLMSSDTGAAIKELETAATPQASAVLDFTLGNLYFQQDKLERAAERYRTAVAKFPSFRRALKNLGLIYARTGKPDEAIKALTRVIELGGGDALTIGMLGYAYNAKGQFLSAESAYRNAVLLQPETLEWKLGLTQSLFKQLKYAEAASLCEELIAQHTDRADLWMLQANAYIGLGQPMKAAENYEVVRRMGKSTVQGLHTLGDIYANESLWDPAAQAYRAALELDPNQGVERSLRDVAVLAQRGALAQAKDLLARVKEIYASRLDDQERKAFLKVEARIAVSEGSGGDALVALEQIVALDPLDGEALMLLGQHYTKADQADQAIFYYERAESLPAFEADAKVRHAQLLVAQSKYGDALPLLKRAQDLKPRDEIARYLEQVEKVVRSRH